jgi:hypothetical protein
MSILTRGAGGGAEHRPRMVMTIPVSPPMTYPPACPVVTLSEDSGSRQRRLSDWTEYR